MLDEPFSALDDFLRWKLELELLEVLKDFTGDTLFVSHSRDEVYRLCDQVCVMEKGSSGSVIPVRQLFEKPSTKAAALLSGCKNYSRAHLDGEGYVFAKDWGVRLKYQGTCTEPIQDIGVRSHYLHLIPQAEANKKENLIHCNILQVVEDVFSIIIMAKPETATTDEPIRIEISKEFWRDFSQKESIEKTIWVQVEPQNVMLLKANHFPLSHRNR